LRVPGEVEAFRSLVALDGSPVPEPFPPGWDEERVERVIYHYEHLDAERQLAEDEAADASKGRPSGSEGRGLR
jgi:hypothetical protein